MLLVDTNVVSELRKSAPNRLVETWVASVPSSDLFLSVIVVEELEKGVLRMERKDQVQGRVLRAWLDLRCCPLSLTAFFRWIWRWRAGLPASRFPIQGRPGTA